MYVQLRESLRFSSHGVLSPRWSAVPSVPRPVVALGLTSMFTDISSEMVSTVLPIYLFVYLALSPIELGILDGLYQGGAALVRVASGFAADRLLRLKEIAFIGYGLSAICKLWLLAASTSGLIAAVVMVDRTGKGIRTVPRDALISLSVPRAQLATAFGVHRALDTAGAMIGPLLAFGVLALAPGAFDAVFVVSFGAALIGLVILALFVERPKASSAPDAGRVTPATAAHMLAGRRFRRLMVAGTVLSLLTVSDSFIFLLMQQHLSTATSTFPLLFVATSLVYFVLALPTGRLADRHGRVPVFLGGYALLVACLTLVLAWPAGEATAVLVLLLLGAYYAATEGVFMALGSAALPPHLRGTGLGVLSAATGLARLLSSVLFGVLWTWSGPEVALLVFAGGLASAVALAWPLLRDVLLGASPDA